MVGPIADTRHVVGQRRQPAGHKIAERFSARVDISTGPVHKIHWNIEHIVDVTLEAEARLKDKGQRAAAVWVGISPDMAAIAEKPARSPLDKGRVGEERHRHRLQRQADPEFLHHVSLGLVVEVGLHGTGAQHHVEAEATLLWHVIAHDPVTLFRHPRHIFAAPFRVEAEPEHSEPELVADFAHLAEVLVHLVAGLVHGLKRRPAKFELPTWFQRDRTSSIIGKSDRVAVFGDRLPSEPSHLTQHGGNPVRSVIRDPSEIRAPEDEFLVLGANPPCRRRFATGFEIFDKLALVGDRRSWRTRRCRHPRRISSGSHDGSSTTQPLNQLTDKHDQRVRMRRQSPAIAWNTATAASAAVSARNTLGPSPTRVTKESFRTASSSVSSNPPSGPTRSPAGAVACRNTASPIGSPAPLSSHTISRRSPG